MMKPNTVYKKGSGSIALEADETNMTTPKHGLQSSTFTLVNFSWMRSSKRQLVFLQANYPRLKMVGCTHVNSLNQRLVPRFAGWSHFLVHIQPTITRTGIFDVDIAHLLPPLSTGTIATVLRPINQ